MSKLIYFNISVIIIIHTLRETERTPMSENFATTFPGADQAAVATLESWHQKKADAPMIYDRPYPGDCVLYSPRYTNLPELDYSPDSERPGEEHPVHQEVLAAFQAAFEPENLVVENVYIQPDNIMVVFANPIQMAVGCGCASPA